MGVLYGVMGNTEYEGKTYDGMFAKFRSPLF